MSFSHEKYWAKESDGHVVIKAIVSGYRKFSIQVIAKAFVPTKFNLPAGQLNLNISTGFYPHCYTYYSKQ